MNPKVGKLGEVKQTLLDVPDALTAYEILQRELRKVRLGIVETEPERIRFDDWSVSLLERKIVRGDIRSARTREIWGTTLKCHLIPPFGAYYMDMFRRADIETWKDAVGAMIYREDYSPHTANSWLRILRVIIGDYVKQYELERNPIAAISDFDVSEHPAHTEEEPNSLTVEEVPKFLRLMRQHWPQHFAFVALGFATGLRPSSLRPLRRAGKTPDVLWDESLLLVRRSHTRKAEVMGKTKTGKRQRITLPEELMEILKWQVDRIPEGPMQDSMLLFPSRTGGFRSSSALDKPFADVTTKMKLDKRFTPKGMRRTFQDLARAAEVKDIVTRAVSGHASAEMQEHYSTVWQKEIHDGVARIISLAGYRDLLGKKAA